MTPAHRFARVLVLPQYLCGSATRLAARRSTAPRGSSGLEMSACPPCSADRAVCDGLTRPPAACLATVRGARARCVRPTSASHYFRLRALAPHSFPASLRGLRLAPSPWACTPDEGDWGTWRFKTPDPLQRAAPGFRAAFLLPRTPGATVLLTPLSPSRGPRFACVKRDSAGSAETVPADVP